MEHEYDHQDGKRKPGERGTQHGLQRSRRRLALVGYHCVLDRSSALDLYLVEHCDSVLDDRKGVAFVALHDVDHYVVLAAGTYAHIPRLGLQGYLGNIFEEDERAVAIAHGQILQFLKVRELAGCRKRQLPGPVFGIASRDVEVVVLQRLKDRQRRDAAGLEFRHVERNPRLALGATDEVDLGDAGNPRDCGAHPGFQILGQRL